MRVSLVVAAVVAVALTPVVADAQRRPARRQAAIEIRGVVPTPQVVTVRPREVPAYSRQVLVPNFYDHDFWQSLLPAYHLVPQRMITGSGLPADSIRPPADTGAMRRTPMTPADTAAARRTNTAPATGAARDTTSRPSGTSPARPPR